MWRLIGPRSFRLRWAGLLLLGSTFLQAWPTAAQQSPAEAARPLPPPPPPAFERPSDRRPESSLPSPGEAAPALVLPPVPAPSLGEIQGDDPERAIVVREVEFRGNTALTREALMQAVTPFLGRPLTAAGLEALRRSVTQVYVAAGYVNSGAVIPRQQILDGRLALRVIEGRLEAVRFTGLAHYRESVLRARVARGLDSPLNVQDVERALRLLDQDPRIGRIDARLRPGAARDLAILEIAIEEADPRRFELSFDNHESPSVGAYAGHLETGHDNVFGFGDRVGVRLTRTEGLTRISGRYQIPLHASGTRLFFDASYGDAELVDGAIDDAFRALQIETSDASLGLGLAQTLWHTPADQVDLALLFERRRSKTELGGRGFSFVDGPQSGRSEISVVRATGDWTHRGLNSVAALRSVLSFGTDWGNPTVSSNSFPDGVFVSWFGQLRGVYRFPRTGVELSLRADLQLADRPLLSLEQFALGGPDSVRGYRRNQIVRDQGYAIAVDARLPVWRAADSRTIFAVRPFVDLGGAWNEDRPTPEIQTLSGFGIGFEWLPLRNLEFEVEWAHGFRDTGSSGDLQDDSVYLRAVWRAF